MEKLTVGSVILIKFPFSNLKNQKIRPALVVANTEFNDLIVCQISSRQHSAISSVSITMQDFAKGSLPVVSYARPSKLFTFSRGLVINKIAEIKRIKKQEVLAGLRDLFTE